MSEPESLPEFRPDCPCVRKKCVRRGKCRECHAHHVSSGKRPPYCMRKKTLLEYLSGLR